MNRYTDVIDEIADLICSSLGMTMASNFFVGELPQSAIDGLYMVELQGPEPDMYVDTETHLFDLYARSNSSVQAKVLLRRAYDVLERKANYPLINWYVYFSYASSTPRDMGRDGEGGRIFAQTWGIICRNTNNIS